MADRSQQTEKATSRRIEKAREEGRFPAAKELVGALQFLAFVMLLAWGGGAWVSKMRPSYDVLMVDRAFHSRLARPEYASGAGRTVWNKPLLPLILAGRRLGGIESGRPPGHHSNGLELEIADPGLRPAERIRAAQGTAAAEPSGSPAGGDHAAAGRHGRLRGGEAIIWQPSSRCPFKISRSALVVVAQAMQSSALEGCRRFRSVRRHRPVPPASPLSHGTCA